jgi:2-polyprenyl-6-hydroxyphenyl methylase/3-demethylubiquinone-9 3-methyltransferase
MYDYYSDKLAGEKLRRVYEIAPPRVRRYLNAEIDYTLTRFDPGAEVLELGCGYGRVLSRLADKAGFTCGIDTSLDSLHMVRKEYPQLENCSLVAMDAACQAFRENSFDAVICIQNGISAFHVDRLELLRQSLKTVRRGGRLIFSSYSEHLWEARLDWFRKQAAAGLLGEIDEQKTGDGVIVCLDGFTATTVSPHAFLRLAGQLGVKAMVSEIDRSSVFCEISKP